jgi:hypothetical protein
MRLPLHDSSGEAAFENEAQLNKLAASVSMSPEQFRQRVGYVAGVEGERARNGAVVRYQLHRI